MANRGDWINLVRECEHSQIISETHDYVVCHHSDRISELGSDRQEAACSREFCPIDEFNSLYSMRGRKTVNILEEIGVWCKYYGKILIAFGVLLFTISIILDIILGVV